MADSGITQLYIAYSIIWVLWFIYLLYLHLKQSKLEKDISNLESVVMRNGRRTKGEE